MPFFTQLRKLKCIEKVVGKIPGLPIIVNILDHGRKFKEGRHVVET